MRFEPAGLTDDPDVRMSQSIMDHIFRRLALDHLSFEERSMLGIYSAEERQRHLETGSYEPIVEETGSAAELVEAPSSAPVAAELLQQITGIAVDSPLCMTCGTKMRPSSRL